MKYSLINRDFYDAIVNFEKSEKAQEYYYSVMDTVIEREGVKDTIRNRILRVYAMYLGSAGFDPDHWYRMQHHFPVIDDDNYDRFAALVIADLKAGPLHEAAVNDADMLLVGELDPLHMTKEERDNQQFRTIHAGGLM